MSTARCYYGLTVKLNDMEMLENDFGTIDELLITYLTGSATDDERRRARAWINENADHQRHFDELKDYYEISKVVQRPTPYRKEDAWQKVKAGYYKARYLEEQSVKNNLRRWSDWRLVAAVAAVAIIALFIGALGYRIGFQPEVQVVYQETTTPKSGRSMVVLADGTKVWLNASSRLRYPSQFEDGIRKVELQGEAYFEVSKNPHRAFVVKTSHLDVKVLGTKFNLKSFADDDQVEATLLEGKVKIENLQSGSLKSVELKPHQQLVLNKLQKTAALLSNVDVSESTSWLEGGLQFKQSTIAEVVKVLERNFNVRFVIRSEKLKRRKFTGSFKNNESLDEILKVVKIATSINYRIDHNLVYLFD